MSSLSLRLRLILVFVILALITWGIASFLAWQQTSKNINELFDTQQMVFAKRLSVLDPETFSVSHSLEKTKKMVPHNRGRQDDDALAFAIFTLDGKMLLNDGDNGRKLRFDYYGDGFVNSTLRGSDDEWRLVWLATADKQHVVVVGQELDYRQEMAQDIVVSQLTPWLVALPLMVLLMIWLITRALKPLRHIAQELSQRQPDDELPLTTRQVPSEVRPMVIALNGLFSRIGNMLIRERQFTSDAAHELRSPLAALKVQTEVAMLAGNDEEMRNHALANLTDGIDRSTRVVDQLLMLSRLDSLSELDEVEKIDWRGLLQSSIADIYHNAQAEGVEFRLDIKQEPKPIRGHRLLLSVLVRNLFDNAVRYSQSGSSVTVTLESNGFSVEDNGPGVSDEFIQRIGERFYRPPGQAKTGSGLGLSIVQRIARLHGLSVKFGNRSQGGFLVNIRWP